VEELETGTSELNALREVLVVQSGLLFVCLDAEPFENLQADLMGTGLDFKPLWPQDEDAFALAEGPHLVAIPDDDERQDAVDDMLEVLAGKPEAAVWWVLPATDGSPKRFEALERHLRSLAMVEVPVERPDADEDDLEEYHDAVAASQINPSVPTPSPWEAVFFRHFDADIMASILPLLDLEQFSRVFGDAELILMQAPDFNGFNEAPRPQSLPSKPAGLLRLNPEQYDELCNIQAHRARLEILRFLRENAEDETEDLSDAALMDKIVEAEKAGYELGIESNEAHSLYAFLSIGTGGESLKSREIKQTFRQSNLSPDATMQAIFDQMISAAEADPAVI